jgi:hypothetical protein
MNPPRRVIAWLCLFLSGASCGDPDAGPENCTPGRIVSCTGPSGCPGTQTCSDDGARFEPCTCVGAAGGDAGAAGSNASGDPIELPDGIWRERLSFPTGEPCTGDICKGDAFCALGPEGPDGRGVCAVLKHPTPSDFNAPCVDTSSCVTDAPLFCYDHRCRAYCDLDTLDCTRYGGECVDIGWFRGVCLYRDEICPPGDNYCLLGIEREEP